jgi:1-acyl-sn-glycerol-3-phosphate acyltransferase
MGGFPMIKSFFINAFIVFHTLFFCTIALPIAVFDPTGIRVHSYIAVPWAKVILWISGVRVDVHGIENIDPARPRIYLVNHQSFFDIFVLLAKLKVHFKFLLKHELMRIPIFGFTMRRARYISIDRENPRKAIQSMNEAAERIKAGASVVVFPEGTRSLDGGLQPFKRGGFHLALKAGCDVVPVTLEGSHKIAKKGSLRINPTNVTMTIGEAIPLKGYNKKNMAEIMTRVHGVMRSQLGQDMA